MQLSFDPHIQTGWTPCCNSALKRIRRYLGLSATLSVTDVLCYNPLHLLPQHWVLGQLFSTTLAELAEL